MVPAKRARLPERLPKKTKRVLQGEISNVNVSVNVSFKAGTLQTKKNEWKKLTSDKWILETIQGYRIEFWKEPFQYTSPKVIDFGKMQNAIVDDEVLDLLEKAISECSYKAAISETLSVCGNDILKNSSTIIRFMKGMFRAFPPTPKYAFTWDVGQLLVFLSNLWPTNDLSLKDLTLKLTALLALCTAQRVQTLHFLKLSLLSDFGDYIVFTINELLKTSKPGQKLKFIRLDRFTNQKLCVVNTLKSYIERTKNSRKSDSLLISYKLHTQVTSSTIARWLKEVLSLSGIDTSVFTAHSYRGASTSKAYSSGLSLSDVLKTANWTNAKTFFRFYNRDCSVSFSNTVLA
ncbi:unnamed protein product [Mytilus coruscus]|uniref:Tyr recombinase domain-containing protein n=1 Tax=Mytilus coruscus TaxID=42192 RepID=A0A6J8BNQ9_MYTCO|nr:unnamed protein product [Mytilus coruscus]